jgi:hypothetical protein
VLTASILEDYTTLTFKNFYKVYEKLILLKITKNKLYKLLRLEYYYLINL